MAKRSMSSLDDVRGGWTLPLVTAMILAAIIVGLSCGARPEPPARLNPMSLRLAWIANVEFAGILLAKEKGFYTDAGIDLTLHPGGVGLDPVQLVAAGSDDIGVAEGSQLIIARAKGIPVKTMFAQFQRSPMCYITLSDSGITSVKQFRGRRLGTQPSFIFVLETMLAHNGMTLQDVKMTPVQFDVRPLAQGHVDAFLSFVTNEPILLDLKGIKTNVILASDNGYQFYSDCLFVKERYVREHSELLRRFVQATMKGWKSALERPDEAAKLVLDKYSKELQLEHQMRELKLLGHMMTEGVGKEGIGTMKMDVWANGIEILLRYKQIERKVTAEEMFTNEFLGTTSNGR